MKYRMMVLDLDDTLLNDDFVVSTENRQALRKAHEEGVIITICSGRVSSSIEGVMRDIGIHGHEDYYISYNGAVVCNGLGDRIFYKTVGGHVLGGLIDIGREYGADIQLYEGEDIIVEQFTSRTAHYQFLSGIKVKQIPDLKVIEDSIKVLYNYDDIPTLERIRKAILERYGDQVHVFFSKPTYLEVIHKEANKGLALAYLAEHLHIKPEEVVAVGDSMNDIYMIEYAGMGVAVKNGRDAVKAVANYVTKATNHEHAIAEVVDLFISKSGSADAH